MTLLDQVHQQNLVAELRRQEEERHQHEEERHQEVLRAIEVLERSFSGTKTSNTLPHENHLPEPSEEVPPHVNRIKKFTKKKAVPQAGTSTIRGKVLHFMSNGNWFTVNELIDQVWHYYAITLEPKQVRGVLGSQDMRDKFDARHRAGTEITEYRYNA